jgi:hypothetical protein
VVPENTTLPELHPLPDDAGGTDLDRGRHLGLGMDNRRWMDRHAAPFLSDP